VAKRLGWFSRNQKTFNYPELLDALKLLPAEHFVIDGEIAAWIRRAGLPSSFYKPTKLASNVLR
jgi:ATP-dependent DNA ligase